jgi:hypothetical protein
VQLMDRRRTAAWLRGQGHEFIEKVVTKRMPATRADKMAVEVNVVADDANDCAVRSAVEHGIEAVSGHGTSQKVVYGGVIRPLYEGLPVLNGMYRPSSPAKQRAVDTPTVWVALFTFGSRMVDAPRGLALRRA